MIYHETEEFEFVTGESGQQDIKIIFDKKGVNQKIAIVNTGTQPTENIKVKISNSEGIIMQNMPLKMFVIPTGNGNFLEVMMPLKFSDMKITVSFTIETALANDFKGTILFFKISEKDYEEQQELIKNGIIKANNTIGTSKSDNYC